MLRVRCDVSLGARAVAVLLAGSLVGVPSLAAAQRLCKQIQKEANTVTIDPRPPHAVTGQAIVRRASRQTIVVCHKNPFAYEYRIKPDTQVIVSTAIADFVQAVYGFAFPDVKAGLPKVNSVAAQQAGATVLKMQQLGMPLEGCSAPVLTVIYHALDSLATVARERALKMKQAFEAESGSAAAFADKTGALLKSLREDVTDSALYVRVNDLTAPFRDRVAKLDSSLKLLDDHWGVLSSATHRYDDELRRAEVLLADCLALLIPAHRERYELQILEAAHSVNRAKVHAHRDSVQARRTTLENLVNNPADLYWTYIAGPFDHATKITIIIERKPQGTKDSEYKRIASVPVHFGGPWTYKLGFGVGWSPIATQRFGVAQRYRAPLDGRPADSLASFITVKENSRQRIAPMLTLVGRLALRDLDTHLTLGATLPKGTASLYPELFTGGGARLYDDLSLSIGTFWANETTLGDGLKVGQAFPTQDVPTKTKFVGRFAVLASYSVR